jgi:BlaI family transcriptional regulator, penicillinase repressor
MELTKAEEQVMQYLWRIEKGFLKDIVEQFPQPRPAYTTVSTVIRVLVKKGFIGYTTYGKIHEYYPKVGKNDYLRSQLKGVVKNYFSNSLKKFASFFTKDDDLSLTELEEIRQIVDEQIKKQKNGKNE